MEDLIKITDELAAQGIYTVQERVDEDGTWIFINGDSGYLTPDWTVETAIADYLTPEAEEKRLMDFYRANGFYD